jgi:phytoene dehydrogenase-like protein
MMADTLLDLFSEHGLVIHLDSEIDQFDVKRGAHDIVAK